MKYNKLLLLALMLLTISAVNFLHAQSDSTPEVSNDPKESEMQEYKLVIDKSQFSMKLYKGTEIMKQYHIALGKNPGDKQEVGDKRTPEGDFVIQQIQVASWWEYDYGDGNGPIKAYGPWFIRLETNAQQTISGKAWTGIGIHGTHDEDSIDTLASRGCIRMYNKELVELVEFLKSLPDYHIAVQIRESIK
jgi:murein L,D-transpeptidase YafK